jgi:hypothetical protein
MSLQQHLKWFIEWLRSWHKPVIPNVIWCEVCQAHHAPPACSE